MGWDFGETASAEFAFPLPVAGMKGKPFTRGESDAGFERYRGRRGSDGECGGRFGVGHGPDRRDRDRLGHGVTTWHLFLAVVRVSRWHVRMGSQLPELFARVVLQRGVAQLAHGLVEP